MLAIFGIRWLTWVKHLFLDNLIQGHFRLWSRAAKVSSDRTSPSCPCQSWEQTKMKSEKKYASFDFLLVALQQQLRLKQQKKVRGSSDFQTTKNKALTYLQINISFWWHARSWKIRPIQISFVIFKTIFADSSQYRVDTRNPNTNPV